jgi:hypothetical protein
MRIAELYKEAAKANASHEKYQPNQQHPESKGQPDRKLNPFKMYLLQKCPADPIFLLHKKTGRRVFIRVTNRT